MEFDRPSGQSPKDVIRTARSLAQLARRVQRGEVEGSFFDNLNSADFLEAFAAALEAEDISPETPDRVTWERLIVALYKGSHRPDTP